MSNAIRHLIAIRLGAHTCALALRTYARACVWERESDVICWDSKSMLVSIQKSPNSGVYKRWLSTFVNYMVYKKLL